MDDRVLLVEDDPSIREVTSLGLRGAGLTVETAVNGREALMRFRAKPYDLVVLDVMLPELMGSRSAGRSDARAAYRSSCSRRAVTPSTSSSASSSAPTTT